jgi:hypothetical protein
VQLVQVEFSVCDKIADVCTHPRAAVAAKSAGRHPNGPINTQGRR